MDKKYEEMLDDTVREVFRQSSMAEPKPIMIDVTENFDPDQPRVPAPTSEDGVVY